MHRIPPIADQIDQRIAELDGMTQIMIFIAEHAEDEELAPMRNAATTLLYLMSDKIREANRQVAILHQIAILPPGGNGPGTPCG